jgi:hypothetical protein
LLALGALVVALCVWAAWHAWSIPPSSGPPPDPRVTSTSPFLNVRPEVKYVGDAVCASCHQEITDAYHGHPMGQSLFLPADAPVIEKYDPPATTFRSGPLRYEVERRGSTLVHRESLVDFTGTTLASLEAEAEWVFGSGRHGRGYLINRDGFLFQSPISWYTQKAAWDLSPGYHSVNPHFERPITAGCLFCHCNHAEPVANTLNRYADPIFRGLSIGCERCHGPGELHAEKPRKEQGIDYTIVNPRHLPADLREGVCHQCHLLGEARIQRAARDVFDYRPGLPFEEFWSIFVRAPELAVDFRAVGQVEQMRVSRCFQGSGGKLGCISCHDPHRIPSDAERPTFYRQRCLSCHEDKPCSLPAAKRREQSAEDSCIQCHMPVIATNVAHTALTDHRVPRLPDTSPVRNPARALRPGEVGLVYFRHNGAPAPLTKGGKGPSEDDAGVERDLAMAIAQSVRRMEGRHPVGPLARRIVPMLDHAVKTWPGDLDAWDLLGYAHRLLGDHKASQAALDSALAHAPQRETTLYELVLLAYQQKDHKAALGYADRLIQVNPVNSSYYLLQAQAAGEVGDWRKMADACRAALRLNIADAETHRLLALSLLALGDATAAEEEFRIMLALGPNNRAELERWWAEEKRKRTTGSQRSASKE